MRQSVPKPLYVFVSGVMKHPLRQNSWIACVTIRNSDGASRKDLREQALLACQYSLPTLKSDESFYVKCYSSYPIQGAPTNVKDHSFGISIKRKSRIIPDTDRWAHAN
jgi:hypothetical protein